MQIVVTTQPDPLVTLDEVKVAIGESGNDRNSLIEGMILAAQAELDGPHGWVGISVAPQSLQARVDSFAGPIRLIGGPIVGDVVGTYLDSSGQSVGLEPTVYVVQLDGTVSLAAGATWPAVSDQADACRFAYDVGIAAPTDPRLSLMKTAIILHVRMTLDGIDPDKARRAIEALVRPMWDPVC